MRIAEGHRGVSSPPEMQRHAFFLLRRHEKSVILV